MIALVALACLASAGGAYALSRARHQRALLRAIAEAPEAPRERSRAWWVAWHESRARELDRTLPGSPAEALGIYHARVASCLRRAPASAIADWYPERAEEATVVDHSHPYREPAFTRGVDRESASAGLPRFKVRHGDRRD